MLQVATVPIAIGIEHPDILGTISVGFLLDDALAGQLKAVTGSDIAFGMDGGVLAVHAVPRSVARRSARCCRRASRRPSRSREKNCRVWRGRCPRAATGGPVGGRGAGAPLANRSDTIPA